MINIKHNRSVVADNQTTTNGISKISLKIALSHYDKIIFPPIVNLAMFIDKKTYGT